MKLKIINRINSYLLYEIIFNIDENSKLNEVYKNQKKYQYKWL